MAILCNLAESSGDFALPMIIGFGWSVKKNTDTLMVSKFDGNFKSTFDGDVLEIDKVEESAEALMIGLAARRCGMESRNTIGTRVRQDTAHKIGIEERLTD